MNDSDDLESRLFSFGKMLEDSPSITSEVMSRIAHVDSVPSKRTAIGWVSVMRPRRGALAAGIALVAVWFGWMLTVDRTAAAFAQQARAALENVLVNGVVLVEHTDLVFRDGSHHRSSTYNKFYTGKNSYRRDIYDGDHLRESQWYVPSESGMTQTSVHFDTKTYTVQRHKGSYGNEDPVERIRFLVNFVGDAQRRLPAMVINGRECLGFEIKSSRYGDNPDEWLDRIWFDPSTKLPVRLEFERPNTSGDMTAIITIRDQIQWLPELQPDTFTPRVPDGFTRQPEATDSPPKT